MGKKQLSPKISDYLTVREAALFLGVSAATLRNWDNAEKLTATRNPLNGYRLYKRSSLLRIRQDIEASFVSRAVPNLT
jgi:DNA-binding transcriptional MerR regulator